MQTVKSIKAKQLSAKKRATPSPNAPTISHDWYVPVVLMALLTGVAFFYDVKLRDPYLSVRFVYVAACLILAFAWFFVYKKVTIPWSHPLTLTFLSASGLFIIWNIICSGQSINIQESIFFISRFLLFFLFFVFVFGILTQYPKAITTLARFFCFVLFTQAIVGIFQYYNIAFTSIPGNPHPTGFSGNRNLYASFLVLLTPFVAYNLFESKRIWQVIALLSLGIGVFAIILGQTRSAWLAFAAAILLFQIGFFVVRKRLPKPLVRNWRLASLGGIVALVGIIAVIFIADKDGTLREGLKNRIVSLYAIRDLSATNEAARNVNERLLVWEGTRKMIVEKPWQGVGPGNWRLQFPAYGGISAIKDDDPKELDKVRVQPHNVYLHVAAETGIPGLLLFLAIGGTLALAALRNIWKSNDMRLLILNLLMLGGLIALAVDMSFSFPTERIEHGTLLMLMGAVILSTLEKTTEQKRTPFQLAAFPYFATVLPILIFLIILGNAKRNFDHAIIEVINYEVRNNYPQVLTAVEKGKSKLVTLDPVSDPLEFHSARAYMYMKQYEKALEEISIAEYYHPSNHRIYNTKAVIYLNQDKYKEAIEPLKNALKYSPNYIPALTNLAYSYYRTDDYQSSMDILNKMNAKQDTSLQQLYLDVERRLANNASKNQQTKQ